MAAEQDILGSVLDHIGQGVSMFDASQCLVTWNQKFEDIMEYPPGTVRVGASMLELTLFNANRGDYGEGDPERLAHDRTEFFFGSTSSEGEYIQKGDKSYRVMFQRLAEGGLILSLTDITDLMKTQANLDEHRRHLEEVVAQRTDELEQNRHRFRDFTETASDWFWEMDADLRFIYLSDSFDENFGRATEVSLGRTKQDIYAAIIESGTVEEQREWHRHFADLEARRPFKNFVQRWITPAGETRFFANNGKPFFDENGDFAGYRGTGSNITERKQAENSLIASEAMLRLVIDNLPVLITYVDTDQRFRLINRTCAEWYGRAQAEIVGKRVAEIHGDRYPLFAPRIKRVLSGESLTFEDEVVYPNGKTRNIRSIHVPDFDPEGAVRGYFSLTEDVTERKRADVALMESEQRFRDFAETASDWFWEMDADLRFSSASESFSVNIGREFEGSLGQTKHDVYAKIIESGTVEEQTDWRRHFADLEARRPFKNFIQRWITPAGEIRFILNNGKPHFDRDGNFTGYRGTASNITERVLAEQALRDSEGRYRALIENDAIGLIVYDDQYRPVFVSPLAAHIFGYDTPDEIMAMPALSPLLAEGEVERIAEIRRRRYAGDGPEEKIDFQGMRKDGAAIWISQRSSLVNWDGAEVVMSALVDITEQRALEERLRQSGKMEAVGQLTGGIAHEFNNLLQVVAGNIGLLEEGVPTGPETSRQFGAINRNVRRGAELTSRLLSFARRQPLAPKAVEIAIVLAEMKAMLGQTLGETIAVKVEPASDVWPAEADPGQLENALLNLAINARDAMPGGGVITLSANNIRLDEQAAAHEEVLPRDYVVLNVADTGSGMTEEAISHAFEPFFTTKDVGKGTGLGLSMVYGFAQQSGGFAEIESEIGVGTTMRLYLPRLAGAENDKAITQDHPSKSASAASGTILLVEDDTDVRELLAAQLRRQGYRVIEAEDGAAALAVLESEPRIDLLFTDVVMPGGLSGLELARQVLLVRPNLKVLYTTGYSEDIVVEMGQMLDGTVVLRKPYDNAKLAATIAQILG